MQQFINRRGFMRGTLGAGVGLSLVSALPLRAFADAGIAVEELRDNVHLLTGAGGNVLALTGEDGVVMVDGGWQKHVDALLEAVGGLPGGGDVSTLFNTHWHPAHTGANLTLGRNGARIIAHENTRLWLTTEIRWDWADRTFEPQPSEALPNDTFYTADTLEANGERIDYTYLLQAHTDGDICVHFRSANVLAAGGIVSPDRYPVADYVTGGWIGGTLEATERLIEMTDEDTRIVPARGAVVTRAYLRDQQEMLETVMERMVELMVQGKGPAEMLAAEVTREFDARWGDPTRFVQHSYRGLWGHVRSLGAGVV